MRCSPGIEQISVWVILLTVLVLIASGRFRMEIVAMGGMHLLGITGIAPPNLIFSGFGHPALATIIAVFFISQGIINSGLMRGLGQTLARRSKRIREQIISIAAVGSLLSAFMNNVGAVGLMLPTVVRMTGRCGSSSGIFGLPRYSFSAERRGENFRVIYLPGDDLRHLFFCLPEKIDKAYL